VSSTAVIELADDVRLAMQDRHGRSVRSMHDEQLPEERAVATS